MKTAFLVNDECPKCGVNWRILMEMVQERNTDNFSTAYYIISNCPVCYEKFGDKLNG